MLINAVHPEQKRMAIVDDGKLLDYNIQMAVKEPITGNIYKGIVMKVERGLQAAFVNYGGKKDGFLPLRDVSQDYFTERREGETTPEGGHGHGRSFLKVGQEVVVQVMREVSERKGALLTSYISLPGRYLVLMPNKQGGGISRKIEDEEDRKRLKEIMDQIKLEEGMGFIVRTAGMSRTKQELSRDYQHLSRLWKEIQKAAAATPAPTVIYQESDFGVCSLRDYFTSEIEEILVDDTETFRKMRAYCKTVSPRMVKIIKLYKDMVPLFDRYSLEDQIRVIYQERVDLKSGGYLVINPTEAMITIDVNSGRGSNKRNVEETAFRTNLEAAEEIARQLRLRDLGGLIVIDFIDMMDRQHQLEIERTFKKALSVDRSRIQMSKISKFGMLELSRQKKQSTIQEISYTACPYCKGTGFRPSLEYIALSAFRKIESQAVKRIYSGLKVSLPHAVSDYLLNQKRLEISRLESMCEMSIHISGHADMPWDDVRMESVPREGTPEGVAEKDRHAEMARERHPGGPGKPREREPQRGNKGASPGKGTDGTGPVPAGGATAGPKAGPAAGPAAGSVTGPKAGTAADQAAVPSTGTAAGPAVETAAGSTPPPAETAKKKPRRRSRHRRKKTAPEASSSAADKGTAPGEAAASTPASLVETDADAFGASADRGSSALGAPADRDTPIDRDASADRGSFANRDASADHADAAGPAVENASPVVPERTPAPKTERQAAPGGSDAGAAARGAAQAPELAEEERKNVKPPSKRTRSRRTAKAPVAATTPASEGSPPAEAAGGQPKKETPAVKASRGKGRSTSRPSPRRQPTVESSEVPAADGDKTPVAAIPAGFPHGEDETPPSLPSPRQVGPEGDGSDA
ncbi:MAG: Rne/Rng family ribonuclease [Pseudomonadota bacterium]|nr:Rne/Rng family ribonuclease [Pseudomonadota bacterium]